jgi:branched-chain amino acid transport system ATP-binding protein
VWRLGVGRTFQITATFASMTVRENVQTALISHAGEVWRFLGRPPTGTAPRPTVSSGRSA